MTEAIFNEWVDPKDSALAGRTQRYPLDLPYKPKDIQHAYTKWVVRARPNDPDSPLIWGKYALMMVGGGHYKPSDKRKALDAVKGKKPKAIKKAAEYGDDGQRETVHEPDVALSTLSTTSTLIGAMGNAGFTVQEAKDCLARHPLAGGAYWNFIHQYPDHEKTEAIVNAMFFERRTDIRMDYSTGEHLDWATEPLTITKSMDPWAAWHPSSHLVEGVQPLGSEDEEGAKDSIYLHPVTGRETKITQERAEAVLFQVRQLTVSLGPHDKSPYIVGSDENPKRVATVNGILECREFKFSYAKGALREGYLPWLLEIGALVEHAGVRKIKKASGRTPDNGYTVAPNVSLGDLYVPWKAASSVEPVGSFNSERERASQPVVDNTPLTPEYLIAMVGLNPTEEGEAA